MMNNTIQDQLPTWQLEIKHAYRDAYQLLKALQIDPTQLKLTSQFKQNFPCRVPQAFVARMKPGDAQDPLLRQVLPLAAEEKLTPGFSTDPLEETQYLTAPGLIHKYHGRALLTLTGACAVHCRYCFRRHFPYHQQNSQANQQAVLEYLKGQPNLNEVILSGGDPLSLTDDKLANWVAQLSTIKHLKRLRIHSRLPVVVPSRITASLCRILSDAPFHVVMVVHANHPNELNESMLPYWQQLRAANIQLLNQSVLLNRVNDNANTLLELSEKLLQAGILPYYLHQLDPVQGAEHFLVPSARAKQTVKELQRIAPGYLVPKWVSDQPHQSSKIILSAD